MVNTTDLWHSYPDNITSMSSFMQWVDSSANGVVGFMILIAVFFITFVSSKSISSTKSGLAASVVTFILSTILVSINLLDWYWSILFMILLLVFAIQNSKENSSVGI